MPEKMFTEAEAIALAKEYGEIESSAAHCRAVDDRGCATADDYDYEMEFVVVAVARLKDKYSSEFIDKHFADLAKHIKYSPKVTKEHRVLCVEQGNSSSHCISEVYRYEIEGYGGDDSPTRYIIDDEECVANSEKGSIANLKSHLEEESDSKKKSALKALKKPVLNYKDGVVCEISADES
tara:strand:- start:7367 stop:7906 length:540 start_codon:yes stop_codon:yes gene_type:complete